MENPTSLNLAGWLGCLAFIVMLANGSLKLTDRIAGRTKTTGISPQPFQVQEVSKLVTRDQCESLHVSVSETIRRHNEQIQNLWDTLRAEHIKIRDEMGRCFKDIERALGRIEGKLEDRDHSLMKQLAQHIEDRLNDRPTA